MKKVSLFPIVFKALFFILTVATAICQTDVKPYIVQLKSGDPLTVQEAKDNILIHCFTDGTTVRNQFEQELIKIIQEDTGITDTVAAHEKAVSPHNKSVSSKMDSLKDAKTAAILLAGALKMEKAIPALAKQVNYITPGRFPGSMEILYEGYPYAVLCGFDQFPAAVSLLMIGDPSIPYLREIIKKHKDLATRLVAYAVFVKIQGKEEYALAKEANRYDGPITLTVGHFTNEKKKDSKPYNDLFLRK